MFICTILSRLTVLLQIRRQNIMQKLSNKTSHFQLGFSPNFSAWPRGATPRPRSGAVAKTSYPMSQVRVVAKRSYPMSKDRDGEGEEQPHIQGAAAARAQEGQEELLHTQGQEGRLVQGKEQQLSFAGAAMKRYPTSKVKETQVRW